jgi:hypothetical protein
MKRTMLICLILALISAVFYVLLQTNVITVPSDSAEDGPRWFGYIMAGCYILGGLLILLKKRWLWIVGLVLNTLIIVVFIIMYIHKTDVLFSAPGLGTKIAQILLEAGLIYLVATYSRGKSQFASQIR